MKTFRVKIGKKYQDVQFIAPNLPTVFMKGNKIYAGTDPFQIHIDDVDDYVDWLMGKQPIKDEETPPGILIETTSKDYLPDFIPLYHASGIKKVNGVRKVSHWKPSNLKLKPGDQIRVARMGTLGINSDGHRLLDGEIPGQARAIPVYILVDFINKIID